MTNCPCGADRSYESCCGPFIAGSALPPTAEALMRSRYTAYTRGDIGYLEKTLAPESRSDFDAGETKKWADSAEWKGLQIISVEKGTERDRTGTVEFVARYGLDGKVLAHHEVSKFRRTSSGQWLFVAGRSRTREDGEPDRNHHPAHTIARDAPKIGRNDPCPCGSGKKYKKCCGAAASRFE